MNAWKLFVALCLVLSTGVAANHRLQNSPEAESRERLGAVARTAINQLFNDFWRDQIQLESEEVRLQRLCYQLGQTTQATISYAVDFGLNSTDPETRKETEQGLVMAISLAGFCSDSAEPLVQSLPSEIRKDIAAQIFEVSEKETVWEILNQLILFSRQ